MDKAMKRTLRWHDKHSQTRGKLTHQKIHKIRERYEIFREHWDEYQKITDSELARKWDVKKEVIAYVCSDRFRGRWCEINDPADITLIRELHAEAQVHRKLALKHGPTRLARDYGLAQTTIVHIGENNTYRGV